MEELYRVGKTKMIGNQQCHRRQLAQLCEQANVRPMMVQNRCFAVSAWDKEVRRICQSYGIIYQGFSLLTANREVIGRSGNSHHRARVGVGLAQVIFRFAMQIGMLPLTGTTKQQHMQEDLAAEQISLSAAKFN